MSKPETITLNAGDEQSFAVPRAIALKLKTVENQLKDLGDAEDTIPLPNVTGPILEKVLEFVKWHHEHPQPGDEERDVSVQAVLEEAKEDNKDAAPKKPKKTPDLTDWDKAFVGGVSYDTLFALMLAANYLDVKRLLEVTAKHVASLIKDKDAEGIRKLFNLKPAFTPEEEEQLRAEIEKIE